MTSMTVRATEGTTASSRPTPSACKNLFALGLVSWMYGRLTEPSTTWIEKKFDDKPAVRDANLAAFRAGYNFGEIAELLAVHYEVEPALAPPGTYRNVNGTQALAYGLIAASVRSGWGCSSPPTRSRPPELLHALSRHRKFGVHTIQAEDEIAAANMALGAAFSGRLADRHERPGMDLKAETIGLAVAMELPLLVVDIQRAGPSTGMLDQDGGRRPADGAVWRHGESPLPVVAASTLPTASTRRSRRRASRRAPHAGDPADRHVPRELVRAVEAAGRRVAPRDRPAVRDRAQRRRPLHALPARRQAGASLGRAGHARLYLHRRPREGGRDRQHLLPAGEPRPHDAPARERIARGGARRGGRRPRRRRHAAGAGLGVELRRDRGRGPAPAREQGLLATAHLRHLNPPPGNLEQVLRAPTSGCWSRR